MDPARLTGGPTGASDKGTIWVYVLVVYGSTRGGTAGLAHMVADACAVQGIKTEVRRAGDVRDLSKADAVIVGGALYSNRWHPDAVAFVGRHRATLQRLPVWFFSSGPLDDSARSGALAPVPQVTTLAREIDIRGHMMFGGLLDKRPSGLFGKFAYGAEGDFRDRRHVAEWVERLAADLKAESPTTVRVIESTTTTVPTPKPTPTLVIKPPEPATPPTEEPVEPEAVAGKTTKGSRLRRYLAQDHVEEDEDEGLDLFGGEDDAEEFADLVGDPSGM